MKILTYAVTIVSMLFWLATPSQAVPPKELQEFRGTSLPLAISPTFRLEVLPVGHGDLASVTNVMPVGFAQGTALRIKPGESASKFIVFVAEGGVDTTDGIAPTTFVAIVNSEGIVYSLPVNTERGNGNLERICIFPAGTDTGYVLFMLAFSEGPNSAVHGFSLGADQQLWNVDCGGAKTLYGWFNVSDLDGNGLYELLTTRSMDGVPGGFSYSAVRELVPEEMRFTGAPGKFRAHFEKELKWIDWIVDTQALIQAHPDSYINTADQGPFFISNYEGTRFGFDSIIELPVPEGNYRHLEEFNRERRNSFTKVTRYQEQLSAWLAGGLFPMVWNMSQ